jgi:Zn finger protein HypA/HybF involved in hydrogenase expression
MHEIAILKNIFQYLDKEEKQSLRKIKKIYISLSEFGSINEEDFRQHYKDASTGTRWASLDIRVQKVSYGPELAITRLDFE